MASIYPVSADTILSLSSNNIRNENQEKFHPNVELYILETSCGVPAYNDIMMLTLK